MEFLWWQAATHQAPSIQLHIAIEPPAIVASPSHSLLSTQDGLIGLWLDEKNNENTKVHDA